MTRLSTLWAANNLCNHENQLRRILIILKAYERQENPIWHCLVIITARHNWQPFKSQLFSWACNYTAVILIVRRTVDQKCVQYLHSYLNRFVIAWCGVKWGLMEDESGIKGGWSNFADLVWFCDLNLKFISTSIIPLNLCKVWLHFF